MMRISSFARSAFLSPAAALVVFGASGCTMLERADKGIGEETQDQNESSSSDGGGMTPSSTPTGMGGAAPASGTQDANLFNGSCPVEPCAEQTGDGDMGGDGDMTVGGDGDGGSTPPADTGLIINGDFSAGTASWNGTNATVDAASGAGCVTPEGTETPVLGWDSVSLEAGATYTLQFDVVGSGDLTAKVGGTMDPWPAYMEQEIVGAASGPQSIQFTMAETATVGLAFILTTPTLCIDNVSLVQD